MLNVQDITSRTGRRPWEYLIYLIGLLACQAACYVRISKVYHVRTCSVSLGRRKRACASSLSSGPVKPPANFFWKPSHPSVRHLHSYGTGIQETRKGGMWW